MVHAKALHDLELAPHTAVCIAPERFVLVGAANVYATAVMDKLFQIIATSLNLLEIVMVKGGE